MQRLFSMFPIGTAGVALVVLRVSVAATLIVNGSPAPDRAVQNWAVVVLLLISMSLCLGVFTPYVAFLNCLIELGLIFVPGQHHRAHLAIAAADSAILALLGPGAYSVDARLFGRRVLTVSPRK